MAFASSQSTPLSDRQLFQERLTRLQPSFYLRLCRLARALLLFHASFLALGVGLILLFFGLFAFMSHSSMLALMLALFFLCLFSYFALRLYLQAKRPMQLGALAEEYFTRCKEVLQYQEGIPEHHIALGNAAQRLASALQYKEYTFYSPPPFLHSLAHTLETFSCFCHWKDFYAVRELLLQRSVAEHIKAVKCEPTHLEIHAALANAYVLLSGLYGDPRKSDSYDEERWIPQERTSAATQERFRKTAERAIEEFKILCAYSPDDPWVHTQLAYSYHDLQMPEEEIREYEILLRLRPGDKETLFKLGMLYFQQGHNADGLRIYEQLKRAHYQKAESLIHFYGAYED